MKDKYNSPGESMGQSGQLSLGNGHILRTILLTDFSVFEMLTLSIPRNDILPTTVAITPMHRHSREDVKCSLISVES